MSSVSQKQPSTFARRVNLNRYYITIKGETWILVDKILYSRPKLFTSRHFLARQNCCSISGGRQSGRHVSKHCLVEQGTINKIGTVKERGTIGGVSRWWRLGEPVPSVHHTVHSVPFIITSTPWQYCSERHVQEIQRPGNYYVVVDTHNGRYHYHTHPNT